MQEPVLQKGLPMARGRWIGLLAVLLLIAGVAAWVVLPHRSELTLSPEELAKHNQAVAHMNRNEIVDAEAILKELAERHPDNETIVVDRAIAAMHRIQGGAAAVPLFEEALKRFPNSDRIRYGLAFLYTMDAKSDQALELLKPLAAKLESGECSDPFVAYRIAVASEDSRDGKGDALRWYKKAVELDPYFYTATFKILTAARVARQPAESIRELDDRRKRLDNHPFGTVVQEKIRRMGPLLDVLPIESRAASLASPPKGGLFLDPVALVVKSEWGLANPSPSASVTVCDIDGNGLLDLFFANANVTASGKVVPNAVLLQIEQGKFRLATDHPLAQVSDVTAALWGDVNDDGFTDVFLCRHGGNQLWVQRAAGKWEIVDGAKIATGPKGKCNGGVMFDADFDGDLDVLLTYDDAPNELLQNDGSGFFKSMGKALGVQGKGKPSRQALAVDLDGDRIPEVIVVQNDGGIETLKSDIKGGYVPVQNLSTIKTATAVVAAAAPLYGKAKIIPSVQKGSRVKLELADVTGDGFLALAESSDGVITASSTDATSRKIPMPALKPSAAWTMANLDPKHGPSLISLPADGSPPVAAHPGPGRFDYFSLSFIGDKDGKKGYRSNRSGIGVKTCARIRDAWLCQYPLSQSSGPGQSLQPMSIGSRGAASADFLFVDWSNGDFQSEFSPTIGKTVSIKELDRIPTDSCPLLFVWNGEKFEFITDFLGVGGIDYLIRPGEYYTPTDPVEHLLLPPSFSPPAESVIKMKILEPAEELTFLDRVALVRYSLQPGWEMTLDERHSALPPKTTHEPRFFRKVVKPSHAVNESGVDCTEYLLEADLHAAPSPPADRRFVGRYEKPHSLTIEFANPIDRVKNPALVIDGWVAFPDAQAGMNSFQAGVGFSAPRLEASGPDGKWSDVYPEFGYPAGMQRQMSLPLPKLPADCRRLRISHELEAHWDRIVLVETEPCPQAVKTEIPISAATLAAVGSPRFDRDRDGKPYWFDYDDRNPNWPARAPLGRYTRFGDCRELIEKGDDASATIGPGEEVHLEFKTPPGAPSGWKSRYVLETRGWCRGMRLYTRNGSRVDPMPTSGLPTEPRDRLHQKFNTRVIGD